MSERLPQSHEQHSHNHETQRASEIHKDKLEAAKKSRHEHAEALDEIRNNIDKQALSAEKTQADKNEHQPSAQHVTRELKAIRYKETMRYVRRHLNPRERKFSSFIHTPAVEKISEVGGKTVARPSGLLGGGLIALIGSIGTLYVARQYGFEVPNSLFMALFVIGFFVGLLGEFIITGFTIRKQVNKRRKYGQL